MRKIKVSILIVFHFFILFFVGGIYCYSTDSQSLTNTISIKNTTTYTVVHQKMDLDGVNYTTYFSETIEVPLGTEVTPPVDTITGFISPNTQTVLLNTFNNTVITYSYDREQYHLTINDSNYVTTETPTGDYYYGTVITLVANEYDNNNNPFLKWSNNNTNRTYTFTITEDTTIGPVYAEGYEITFEPNGGSPIPSVLERFENQALGALPVVTRDDCATTSGSYSERGCTYAYRFEGWFTEPEFINQVNEDYVPNRDMTLYAKWNKVYFHDDQEVFNGKNMIDTEIALFSEQNANKDFIVTFTLTDMKNGQGVGGEKRAVLFSDLNEISPVFPGAMFRYDTTNSVRDFQIVANVNPGDNTYGGRMTTTVSDFEVGMTFVMKRESGILSYSIDGGQTFIQYNDFSNFNRYFDIPATFGGEYKSDLTPYRYFKGTLTNMTVELIEPKSYTVKFNANGGTGMMLDQVILLDSSITLRPNNFTKPRSEFLGWNTEPDGSGTPYTDEQLVSGIANEGEVVTLYAQWQDTDVYYVAFDANGGTGSMENQEIPLNTAQNLNPSEFSKEGYIFDSWNTEPDGSGTRYEEEERVMNLTNVPDEVVTLYARYGKREYHHDGEISFNGVDEYIDTEVNLYSAVNINKDFDISFDLIYADPINGTVYQPTILNAKDESHIISGTNNKVPGFAVRFNGKYSPIDIKGRWGSKDSTDQVPTENVPIHFEFHRRNGVVTSTYSYNDGANTHTITLYDQKNWSLESNNNENITIGARVANGVADRFFTGTLANIDIVVYE